MIKCASHLIPHSIKITQKCVWDINKKRKIRQTENKNQPIVPCYVLVTILLCNYILTKVLNSSSFLPTVSLPTLSLLQHHIPHTKAQVLSRRVWDILTLLPTSPTLLDGFQQVDAESKLQHLLDPASPQKLMYSLYIVESLSRSSSLHKKSVSSRLCCKQSKLLMPVMKFEDSTRVTSLFCTQKPKMGPRFSNNHA